MKTLPLQSFDSEAFENDLAKNLSPPTVYGKGPAGISVTPPYLGMFQILELLTHENSCVHDRSARPLFYTSLSQQWCQYCLRMLVQARDGQKSPVAACSHLPALLTTVNETSGPLKLTGRTMSGNVNTF